LTNLAYHKREISIFGGDQLRPNIHIKDMVEVYMVLLRAPKEKIAGQIYNAGYENHSVKNIAETVKDAVGDDVKLVTSHSDDNRSYHVSSKKIQNELGFEAKHTIRDAVEDLCEAFDKGLLPNSLEDEMYFNIKRMNNLELN
jgi:nucleoside-diphosphate-sugar epimerase